MNNDDILSILNKLVIKVERLETKLTTTLSICTGFVLLLLGTWAWVYNSNSSLVFWGAYWND